MKTGKKYKQGTTWLFSLESNDEGREEKSEETTTHPLPPFIRLGNKHNQTKKQTQTNKVT